MWILKYLLCDVSYLPSYLHFFVFAIFLLSVVCMTTDSSSFLHSLCVDCCLVSPAPAAESEPQRRWLLVPVDGLMISSPVTAQQIGRHKAHMQIHSRNLGSQTEDTPCMLMLAFAEENGNFVIKWHSHINPFVAAMNNVWLDPRPAAACHETRETWRVRYVFNLGIFWASYLSTPRKSDLSWNHILEPSVYNLVKTREFI